MKNGKSGYGSESLQIKPFLKGWINDKKNLFDH